MMMIIGFSRQISVKLLANTNGFTFKTTPDFWKIKLSAASVFFLPCGRVFYRWTQSEHSRRSNRQSKTTGENPRYAPVPE
jgi:hypothetical protein